MPSFGPTFLISVFAGEIRVAFDRSRGAWRGIYMLGTGAAAGAMVWAGGLTDRFRVRTLGPVVNFALRFLGQDMASHIAVVVMARCFVRARGPRAVDRHAWLRAGRGTARARLIGLPKRAARPHIGLMPILLLIIIGAAAGFIATRVMDFRAGLPTTILIGVLGALIGGLVLRFILMLTGVAAGFIGAVLGALLLIWIWQRYVS